MAFSVLLVMGDWYENMGDENENYECVKVNSLAMA